MSIKISKQFKDIKLKGYKEFLKKFLIFIKILTKFSFWKNRFFFTIPSIFIIIIIFLLKPLINIRIGLIHRRIGHFLNLEYFLLEDKFFNSKNNFDIWFWPKYIPNKQIKIMIERKLRTLNFGNRIATEIKNILYLFSLNKYVIIGDNTQGDRDVNNFLDRTKSQFTLNEIEFKKGIRLLNEMGISTKKPIVCIIIRDPAYLNIIHPENDFSTQDHRDSSIENYYETARFLADKGYQVVRMGSIVKERFNISHPLIFDYANSKYRSDFMDVFFAFICKFTISNPTGWDALPVIFRKPILFVNDLPLIAMKTYSKKYINIFKHHFNTQNKKYLNMKEIVEFGLHDVYEYHPFKAKNVVLIENSSDEILEATKEMIDLIKNDFKDKISLNQRRVCELFPKNYINIYNKRKMHGKIKSRFSNYFVTKNKYLLSND